MKKLKILVLDQNKSDLNKTLDKIEKAYGKDGQSCEVIAGIDEARNKLKEKSYDYFISEIPDIKNSDEENEEIIKSIIELAGKTPVLILTSHQSEYLSLRAVQLGAQDYLLKGKGTEKTLRRIIEHSIERRRHINQIDKMKKKLEETNKNLEMIVRERTADLEKANKAKTIFFANVTHELRTPLHAIINLSQFGAEKINSAEKEKLLGYFENIYKSGNRLLNLVDDILDFTKAQMSNLNNKFREFTFEKFIAYLKDSVFELQPLADDKKISFKFENNSSKEFVYLDENRIKQVIVNLISNAIKFSPDDSTILISIRDHLLHPKHGNSPESIAISVVDEGTGISGDELESIFDEFAQSQKKIRTGGYSKGTGLGLAISKQMIMGHNGRIWAKNNDSKGSTVTFTLPVRKKDLPAF
jgi:signal transduction histidine kinase